MRVSCREWVSAQLYNHQDILLFASDGKAYFQPATEICGEEATRTASLQRSFDSHGISSISSSSHTLPLILQLCPQTISY